MMWDSNGRQGQMLKLAIQEAGRKGAKDSIPRIAAKAGVSEKFVRDLLPGPKNREVSKIRSVLRVVQLELEEVWSE